MDRRRLAMAGAVAVSMGVGAFAGAVVFTPGVGLATSDTRSGLGAAAAVCADAIGPLRASPLGAAADAIGIRPVALLAELADGRTIAEVARDRGVDVAEVVDAVAGALRERLDAAVDAGWIDEGEADERAAALEETAGAIVDGELSGGRPFPHVIPGFGPGPHEHGFLLPPSLGGGWGAVGDAEASVH